MFSVKRQCSRYPVIRCGYIEGYYGRLLSWEERKFLVDRLHHLRLRNYLYAPKEDQWQRHAWRIPYPKRWRANFCRFVSYAHRQGVRVVAAISPGLSFDYCNRTHHRALAAKARAFLADGAKAIALLMDDISPRLPSHCRGSYRSLGDAHGKLAARLLEDLCKAGFDCDFWFCPTVYCDEMIGGNAGPCRYLEDLAAALPSKSIVLWTGTHVISPQINPQVLAPILQLFPHRVVVWDNLYANDYCPRSLFWGPYHGRDREILKEIAGIMLNATGLVYTDALLLELLAGFLRGADAQRCWAAAIGRLEFKREIRAVAPFFAVPGWLKPKLDHAVLRSVRRALKQLIWDWKSPLQREWYPYLYGLDIDLQLLLGRQDEAWIGRKYPPALTALVGRQNREDIDTTAQQ